jgi:hypothetical protein
VVHEQQLTNWEHQAKQLREQDQYVVVAEYWAKMVVT